MPFVVVKKKTKIIKDKNKCIIVRLLGNSEIINEFLLAGDTFMPEIHVRQSGFT